MLSANMHTVGWQKKVLDRFSNEVLFSASDRSSSLVGSPRHHEHDLGVLQLRSFVRVDAWRMCCEYNAPHSLAHMKISTHDVRRVNVPSESCRAKADGMTSNAYGRILVNGGEAYSIG